ncbi:hypothetical protein HZA43_02105 [Candidatus Peregrinibacteria bacterium]|nr:hypothetical protein [Candidatus Peregrinibacteria bacterium]
MIPRIVTPSDFRKHLADFISLASQQLVVIQGRGSNRVLMDEKEFNRLSALANQFIQEDPEGKYRPNFEREIMKRSQDNNIDESIKCLSDLV